jgi:hypothetical protein
MVIVVPSSVVVLRRTPADPLNQLGKGLILSPIGSADAFMKLATPCTILSLRAVTASFVFQS